MRKFNLLDICLSLFDGGTAAAGGDGGGASAPTGEGASTSGGSQASPAAAGRGGPLDAGRDTKMPAARRRGAGDTQRVLYGKQPAPAVAGDKGGIRKDTPPAAGEDSTQSGAPAKPQGFVGRGGTAERTSPGASAGAGDTELVPTTSNTLEEKRKAYRALVEGEYKDVYTEDTQHIIDRRFRETRKLEEQLGQLQPVIDLLMQRYKIADGDASKLVKAVENDDAYWLQAADEAGMSVEQYKHFQRLQRENEALLRAQRESQAQQRANQRLQQWYGEAGKVKSLYPSFDLSAEVKNPQFLSMLRSGVPVQHAYEVIHMEEIKAGVAALQAKATEKQVVDGIRAKGSRPQENGISSQSAFTVKDDVSKLSRKDRAEIARRVARGETIIF